MYEVHEVGSIICNCIFPVGRNDLSTEIFSGQFAYIDLEKR